jgi:hypothetical protein
MRTKRASTELWTKLWIEARDMRAHATKPEELRRIDGAAGELTVTSPPTPSPHCGEGATRDGDLVR